LNNFENIGNPASARLSGIFIHLLTHSIP